jgi:5-methylcytosine-specific restriction protein A
MPMRGERICVCGKRVSNGMRCVCQQQRKAEADARRPSARARGYDGKWQTESKAFLARPENQRCACGCGRRADMVDHIIPHRGDMRLFWSRANWQPMAAVPCHVSHKQSLESKMSHRGGVADFPATLLDRSGRTAQDRAKISFSALVKP